MKRYLSIVIIIMTFLMVYTQGCNMFKSPAEPIKTAIPDTFEGLYNEGLSLAGEEKYSEAIECFDKAIELDPENPYAWNEKGNILYSQDNYEEAIKCYDRALKIKPDSSVFLCNKGNVLVSQRKYEEAIICYDKAIKLEPENENARKYKWETLKALKTLKYHNRGDEVYNSGKYKEAIKYYDKVLSINPGDASAWYKKGNSWICLGNYENAVTCYDRALNINPEDDYVLCGKGNALSGLKKYEEAISCYDKVMKINPEFPDIENYRNDVLKKLGNIVELLEKKKIEVKVEGGGITNVSLKVRRLTEEELTVYIPVGIFFVSQNPSAQNMVTTAEESAVLSDGEWVSVYVPAACASIERDIPCGEDTFSICQSSGQKDLEKLLPVLEKEGVNSDIKQAAIWIITDNAGYYDLGTLVEDTGFSTFGGTRVINEYEAAMAIKLCHEAGIDITARAIWQDKDLIIQGLEDENLKSYIQSIIPSGSVLPEAKPENIYVPENNTCESRLTRLAVMLELYATDHFGLYPAVLEDLIAEGYTGELPVCPVCNMKYGYSVNETKNDYVLYCPVPDTHTDIPGIAPGYWPQYKPQSGIMIGPE